MSDPVDAAGDRLLRALRARAQQVGVEADDSELLERLERELTEYGDGRVHAVRALRERLHEAAPVW